MSVTPELVEHVARLARLRLEGAELERLTAELNGILVHVDALREANIEGTEATGGVAEGPAVLRADDPGADVLAANPAAFAPAWADGFFTVPKLAALGGITGDE